MSQPGLSEGEALLPAHYGMPIKFVLPECSEVQMEGSRTRSWRKSSRHSEFSVAVLRWLCPSTVQFRTEHPAGAFKARGTPSNMRWIEVMGIESARRWGCSSLNDFRKVRTRDLHPSPRGSNVPVVPWPEAVYDLLGMES